MATRSKGIIFEHLDISTAKSRTGYVVKYAGCSWTWASKMQTGMAFSTTEAELIALSEGLRTVKFP